MVRYHSAPRARIGRQVGQRLDVVDDRRLTVEPLGRGKRRAQPRLPQLAFQRLEQGRFFAADVGPRPQVHSHLEAVRGPEQVAAQEAAALEFGDAFLEAPSEIPEFAAAVDVGRRGLGGIGAQRHPLQELVGVALHDLAVFERARLGLVGVNDDVTREDIGREEAPLHAGRETGPAPPAQARGLDDLDDLRRLLGGHRLAQRFEAAVLQVDVELVDVGDVEVAQQDVLSHRPAPRRTWSIHAMADSRVWFSW